MYFKVSPYQEVLEGITTALQVNEGILKIIGREGTGKSALCNQLLRYLENRKQLTLLFISPPKSVAAMQDQILDFLGIDTSISFTKALTSYLLAKPAQQRLLYLIFDDAQQIDEQTFTAIRMLCNIQDDHNALIKPVICGTPVLDEKLAAPNFRSVGQYLSQSFTLLPMTAEQLKNFYWTYWVSQGVQIQPPSDKLINSIFKQTHGFPGAVVDLLKQTQSKQAEKPKASPAPGSRPVAAVPQRAENPATYLPPRTDKAAGNGERYYLSAFLGILVLGIGGTMYYLNHKVAQQTDMQRSMAERAASYEPEPDTQPATAQAATETQTANTMAATTDTPEMSPEAALAQEITSIEQEQLPAQSSAEVVAAEVLATADATEAEVAAEAEAADETQAVTEAQTIVTTDTATTDTSTTAAAAAITTAASEPATSADTIAEQTNQSAVAIAEEPATAAAAIPALPPALTALLAEWTSSWQQKDIDGYLSFYHPDFSSSTADNLEQWQSQRRRSIGRAADIHISYDRVEIMQDSPAQMTVRLWLNYQASNYGDSTLKELVLDKTASPWLIRSETNLLIERTE